MRPLYDRGVALILVIFLVALASTLVINLTYSTHLSSRRNAMVERGFQAEYLLKSAVNFARVLIKFDKTSEDSEKDFWGQFINGEPIPPDLLEIDQPNVRIELEIRPEGSKIPLKRLIPVLSGHPEQKWRDTFMRLFKSLGFDDDTDQVDQTGTFPGRHFLSEELVTMLIDYQDSDTEPYDPIKANHTAFANGVEGPQTKGLFLNDKIKRIGELAAIPGFTPERLRKLTPYLTTFESNVNINTVPKIILKALNDSLDDQMADSIIEFRQGSDGPFTDRNYPTKLIEIIGDNLYRDLSIMINKSGNEFQVLAKVEYEASTFFMRAYLKRGPPGELPEIESIELF